VLCVSVVRVGVSHCIVTSNDLLAHMTEHKQAIKMRDYRKHFTCRLQFM